MEDLRTGVRFPPPPPFDTVQRTHVEGLRLPMMGITKVGGDCDGLKLKGNILGAILGTLRLNISFKYEVYKYLARDLRLLDGRSNRQIVVSSLAGHTSETIKFVRGL
jgi:hypothetical protein